MMVKKMSRSKFSLLSKDEIDDIHNATLEVLENPGLKIHSERALNILEKAGAKIDYEKKLASIPEYLVKEALKKAPKRVKYCARNPKYDFWLDKTSTHFTTDGQAIFIRDFETGERRPSTNDDLARWTILADYLSTVHVIWVSLTPTDVPEPIQRLTEFFTCLNNSEKHVEHGALGSKQAQYAMEMAATIVGGKEELRKRPIISAIQCPIAPLKYEKESMDAAIEFAKGGIPVVILSMPLTGLSGPATIAGSLVINNTEVLGNVVISQFTNPGAPVIYGGCPGCIDFKTGSYVKGPETALLNAALTQLARYYDLPCEISGGSSSSKVPDAQAAYERTMILTITILSRPDILCGLGALESAKTMCPEMLLIDSEIIEAILRIADGFEVNDYTLAVDIIRKVGPGGHFLAEKHTVDNILKEHWIPKISDRQPYDAWEKAGAKDIIKVAREKVKEILATHKPEPLPEDVRKEILDLLKKYQNEVLKGKNN